MTPEIETMGDQKMSEDPANAPKTDPLDDPKASGEVLEVARTSGSVDHDVAPCDGVLTKDGKAAIVVRVVTIKPEPKKGEDGEWTNEPHYYLIDAVVFEVVNGQPKLSAIKQGKYGEDWKWPYEE